jgi:O-antigen ligase
MDKSINSWNARLFSACLLLLFLLVPFYGHENMGGPHLALPFNVTGWAVLSWIIGLALFNLSSKRQFTYPVLWPFFVFFPLIVILTSLITTVDMPVEWIFRLLYILGGLFFFFALFQLPIKQKKLDDYLLVLVLSTGLQALIGTLHTIDISYFPSWLPNNPGFIPRGIFQQVNLLASFSVTGMCLCLYLISRPSFLTSSMFVKAVVAVCFSLVVYVVIASGSRVGLLSMFLAIPLIFLARYRQLKKHKLLLFIIGTMSIITIYAGQAGLSKTIDKTVKLTDESYSSARIEMYAIGIELAKKEPVSGYGIGSFLRAWNHQASDYMTRHPAVNLPKITVHPHNEILFWMIEGGFLSVLGIVVVILGVIIGICKCGFQRGGAYAAMLLPISLHTQVEHPFYTSSLHWFLWLFILFLVLRHQRKTVLLTLSASATKTLQLSGILLAVVVTLFMVNTMSAQLALYHFTHDKTMKPAHLQLALHNLYTSQAAEKVAMRTTLYAGVDRDDHAMVQKFEYWALAYVKKSPELKMYEDLISASLFLRPEGKGCDAIRAGYEMYIHNKTLKQAEQNCTDSEFLN